MVAGLCIFISFISFHVLLFHLITFLIPLFPFISLCLPFCKHFKGSFLPDLFGFSPGPPLAGATLGVAGEPRTGGSIKRGAGTWAAPTSTRSLRPGPSPFHPSGL